MDPVSAQDPGGLEPEVGVGTSMGATWCGRMSTSTDPVGTSARTGDVRESGRESRADLRACPDQ
jgi:hypothetical protein